MEILTCRRDNPQTGDSAKGCAHFGANAGKAMGVAAPPRISSVPQKALSALHGAPIFFCCMLAFALTFLAHHAIAAPPDFSVAGISLGMTLDQVKAALPKDFTVTVDEHPPGLLSGQILEGVDTTSEIVTAIKTTSSQCPNNASGQLTDTESYGIQLLNGKVFYAYHGQTFQGGQGNQNAILESKMIDGMKAKYGFVFPEHQDIEWQAVSGHMYFDSKSQLLDRVSQLNLSPTGFCWSGDNNMQFLNISGFAPVYLQLEANPNRTGQRFVPFDDVDKDVEATYTPDPTGHLASYCVSVIDFTDIRNLCTKILANQKARLQRESNATKNNAPNL